MGEQCEPDGQKVNFLQKMLSEFSAADAKIRDGTGEQIESADLMPSCVIVHCQSAYK